MDSLILWFVGGLCVLFGAVLFGKDQRIKDLEEEIEDLQEDLQDQKIKAAHWQQLYFEDK